MGYCFMRIEKIKTKNSMTRRYQHNYRLIDIKNADPSKKDLNEKLVKLNGKTYGEAFDERISSMGYYQRKPGEKEKTVRSNAVLGLEVVLTFSREDIGNVDLEKWKQDNIEWLNKTFNANKEKYGNNVLSAQYHADEEGNVHIHAFVVPIDDKGKLNASYYIDGKQKMRELQTSYGNLMKENHNLKRGLENSVAKHEQVRHFYGALSKAQKQEAPKPLHDENINDYARRVQDAFQTLNEQILAMELKEKRKRSEIKTISLNEKLELEESREKLKVLDSILQKFGSLEFIQDRLETIYNLNSGLNNYPDREYANKAKEMIQTLIAYESEEKQKGQNMEEQEEL